MPTLTRPDQSIGAAGGAGPTLVIPADDTLAAEPATVIARAQAWKNAAVVVLGLVGFAVSPELSGELDLVIKSVVTVGFLAWAAWSALSQGRSTADVVFSPRTVQEVAESVARVGSVDVIADRRTAKPRVL